MPKFAALGLVAVLLSGCTTKQDTMNTSFEEIEIWLRSNAPPLLTLLNPPANETAIVALEHKHKLTFPPHVRQLYLIHDGESEKSDGIFGCWKMLPLKEIDEEIELIGEVGMIPLFRSGGGDLYYVKSHDPEKSDDTLREWWHENPSEAKVVSPGVSEFLGEFSQKLQNGQFVYQPDELAALIDKNDL